MTHGKKRLALLVGCNYPNTEYELHGCINDVVAMQGLLTDRFGFEPTSIQHLTDSPGSKVMPTGANIRKALDKMVDEAEEGDVLFFHYSGHGTLLNKHHLKREEAIVPSDFNLITDVDFRLLVNRLPKGVTFTILSDSCHSGGLIDKEKEQVGPNNLPPTAQTNMSGANLSKSKTIPYESLLGQLSSLTNMVESDIGPHLMALFGEEASQKFSLSKVELNQLFGRGQRPDSGILLSGCETNETSADMPGGPGGKAQGAFSSAVQSILRKWQGPISNKEVVVLAREKLKEKGLGDQHPCLYCSDDSVEAPFLLWDVGTK